VARVQPPGEKPGWAFGAAGGRCLRCAGRSISGGRRTADPAGRRRWLRHFLGVCLIAAVVSWPATLASAATGGPPAPSGLSAAAAGTSQISLNWTAPAADTSPSQYNIYEGTSSGGESLIGNSSGTGYTATGLTSGTTYYFYVTAVYQSCIDQPCANYESSPSNEASATTGFSAPEAPTGLTATAAGTSRISLSWTAPTASAGASVTGYKIYAGTSPGSESPVGSSSATSNTVTGLTSGTTYYLEVTAVYQSCIDVPCQDTESSRSNEASATTDRVTQGLKSQVIHFGPLAPHVVGVRFTVLASASSGLPVSFGSDTPRVCSVSGSVVTTIKRGRCTITATQGGNADYSPGAQTQSFRVKRALGQLRPQAITFLRPADVAAPRPVKLSASASSGLPVSFRSDTPSVCSMSGSKVTIIRVGRCTITAAQSGNTKYAPARDETRSFQVGPVTPRAPWALVIALAALVLAAAAGALLVHWRRVRVHWRAKPSVRAYAGPSGTTRLHVTGTDVASTVRIEPHPAQVSSQLEGAQP
jgi:Fibronectin type III domain